MTRSSIHPVAFVTDPSARIILLGNWTRSQESAPFASPAGETLAAAMREACLRPEDFQPIDVVDATPDWESASWLASALRTFQPPAVVCLGVAATRTMLGPDVTFSEVAGLWYPAPWMGGSVHITRSPLAALAQGDQRSQRAFAHIVQTLRCAAASEALSMRAA